VPSLILRDTHPIRPPLVRTVLKFPSTGVFLTTWPPGVCVGNATSPRSVSGSQRAEQACRVRCSRTLDRGDVPVIWPTRIRRVPAVPWTVFTPEETVAVRSPTATVAPPARPWEAVRTGAARGSRSPYLITAAVTRRLDTPQRRMRHARAPQASASAVTGLDAEGETREAVLGLLITQRSQVRILPPLPA
jgi:hypothetical protein